VSMPSQSLSRVLEWRKDWTGRYDPSVIRVRRAYLETLAPRDIVLLSNRVREARRGRMALAHELAFPVEDELEMVSGVESTSNPFELAGLADVPGDDCFVTQQRFEALCVLDLAVMMSELERGDPMDRVEADQGAMIALLEEHVFSGTPIDLDVFTYHDPAPSGMYRVREVRYQDPASLPAWLERKHNSRCRITRDGIVAHFTGKPKDRFDTVIKLLRQVSRPKEGWNPCVVKDRCRCTFVVQDIGCVRALSGELRSVLGVHGALLHDGGDNLTVMTTGASDPTNPFSSPKFRKKQFDLQWHGRWYEIQIVTFDGFYGARYASDTQNHAIYKLLQGTRDILPAFYPPHVYLEDGETWSAPELQRLLLDRQVQNLGWSQRRRNGHAGSH